MSWDYEVELKPIINSDLITDDEIYYHHQLDVLIRAANIAEGAKLGTGAYFLATKEEEGIKKIQVEGETSLVTETPIA